MYKKMYGLLIVLALPLGGAGDAALDRATLRGLTAVNVVIDPVAPDIEKEGATAAGLRTRLEEQLRSAGVRIDTASNEFVAIRVLSARPARGPLALAVTIGLYQPVALARDRNLRTSTQTWEAETVVLADSKLVYRACMDSVDELTGRFVKAYQSVNPSGADKAK
jgi:hypothetical protein